MRKVFQNAFWGIKKVKIGAVAPLFCICGVVFVDFRIVLRVLGKIII